MKTEKALILAAGFGSRLKEYTKNIPKALVKVKGKPIIEYQLSALEEIGIKKVGIVCGYKKEVLTDYLKNRNNEFEYELFYNNEYDRSNSSYSFYMAKDFLKGSSYIHFNCDIVVSGKLLEGLIKSNYENVIAVRRDIRLGDNMELVKIVDNKIIKMDNRYYKDADGKAYGVARFSEESVDLALKYIGKFIDSGDKNQNYYGILRRTVKEIDYYAYLAEDEIMYEVNTVEDLKKVERILGNGDRI